MFISHQLMKRVADAAECHTSSEMCNTANHQVRSCYACGLLVDCGAVIELLAACRDLRTWTLLRFGQIVEDDEGCRDDE